MSFYDGPMNKVKPLATGCDAGTPFLPLPEERAKSDRRYYLQMVLDRLGPGLDPSCYIDAAKRFESYVKGD